MSTTLVLASFVGVCFWKISSLLSSTFLVDFTCEADGLSRLPLIPSLVAQENLVC
jgi:hypothetical protein